MEAFYDNKPAVLEAVGNGSYIYRWNIQEIEEPATEDDDTPAGRQWRCDEVTVWSPVTSNRITEAVITSKWNANYEQKLINEYNSAKLGLYGTATSAKSKKCTQAYKEYLSERDALKQQIDADCIEVGIM